MLWYKKKLSIYYSSDVGPIEMYYLSCPGTLNISAKNFHQNQSANLPLLDDGWHSNAAKAAKKINLKHTLHC